MDEMIRVSLENEMDLILVHKHSMRLAELTGLSLAAQTAFATAVSEVCRIVIEDPENSYLDLGIAHKKNATNFIVAKIMDGRKRRITVKNEGYQYAKKLVERIELIDDGTKTLIELCYKVPEKMSIDKDLLAKWNIILNTDPAVSPYDEIKRKNKLLHQLANSLKESEQTYVSLTDSLPLIIYTLDMQGNVIYANKWLLEYSGESIESLTSNKWENILHPEDFKNGWTDWEKSKSSGTPKKVERRLKHAVTGEYKWHTGVRTPIKDSSGQITKLNIFLVDVDAEKKIEQTLKDNQELRDTKAELEHKIAELNQSNKQLEQFAYITSHDLQEPLRKISFYSDFLAKKHGHVIPAEARVFFGNLINASERMKLLIQDVLAYSVVRKDDFLKVNLNDVAKEAIKEFEISIKEKNAIVTVSVLPVIDGNIRQLKQLFENLISNSLKFSQADMRPVIAITSEVKNGNVVLTFTDNGIGFEEEYVDKMFDLFQRLHSGGKYPGTGIGLGICKKIIEIHNGAIVAVSKPGDGATFIVTLPLKQEHSQK